MFSDGRKQFQRALILGLIFCTGASALLYEVAWHKYLANLLGSQALAATLTLSVFMGALALGYWLFGRFTQGKSPQYLIKTCAIAEAGIGVWAFIFSDIYGVVWNNIGIISPTSALSPVFDAAIAMLLIGPPTVLMGGTIPLLTQALSWNLAESSRIHTVIYGINTLGAFLGCWLANLWLIHSLGLSMSVLLAGTINIVAGLLLYGLGTMWRDSAASEHKSEAAVSEPQGDSIDRRIPFGVSLALATLAGLISITFQTLLIRVSGISFGSTEYAFGTVVSLFIFLLALGSLTLRATTNSYSKIVINQVLMLATLVAGYMATDSLGYIAHLVRITFAYNAVSFYAYQIGIFVALALIFGLPIICMGRTLPLVFSLSVQSQKSSGLDVGKIYSVNAVGCILGALVGGYLGFFIFDIEGIFRFVLLTAAASCLIILYQQVAKQKALIAATAALVIAPFFVSYDDSRMSLGLFRQQSAADWSLAGVEAAYDANYRNAKLLSRDDGPNTTVAVTESQSNNPDAPEKNLSIFVNGKSDGNTEHDAWTMLMAGHLPALLTSDTTDQSAAVIGFGTGMTVGALTLHDRVTDIDVIEISQAVRNQAPLFDPYNFNVTKSDKVTWQIADAYRFLGSTEKSYDMIISEPSNPWISGVEKVFSHEFYQITKNKLKPGGIYAQWFHTYAVSSDTIKMVLNTLGQTFKHRVIFAAQGDIIVLATDEALTKVHLEQMAQRIESSPAIRNNLEELKMDSVERIVAREIPMAWRAVSDGGVHDLENPKLAYAAGYDFFVRNKSTLQRVIGEPGFRLFFKEAYDNALSRYYIDNPDIDNATLAEMTEGACSTTLAKLKTTTNYDLRCRKMLSIITERGTLARETWLLPEEIKGLDLLAGTNGVEPETNQDLLAMVNALTGFHGTKFNTSPESLVAAALKICPEANDSAQNCFVRNIEALQNSGELEQADRVLLGAKEHFKPRAYNEVVAMQIYLKLRMQGDDQSTGQIAH